MNFYFISFFQKFKTKDMVGIVYWNNIPNELWTVIMLFCDDDILYLSFDVVSKKFHEILQSEYMLKEMISQRQKMMYHKEDSIKTHLKKTFFRLNEAVVVFEPPIELSLKDKYMGPCVCKYSVLLVKRTKIVSNNKFDVILTCKLFDDHKNSQTNDDVVVKGFKFYCCSKTSMLFNGRDKYYGAMNTKIADTCSKTIIYDDADKRIEVHHLYHFIPKDKYVFKDEHQPSYFY